MEYSLLLARALNVPLTVLHVLAGMGAPRIHDYEEGGEAGGSECDRALAAGFGALRSAAESAGVAVRFLVGRGPLPGPVILEEAQREGANLIVLGAHGGGEAEADKLGTVATDIVRRSTCPVLIVPPHVEEGAADDEVQRVVTFVSFAHLIEPVVSVASQVARLFGARLDVLAQVDGLAVDGPQWEELQEKLHAIVIRRGGEVETPGYEDIRLHPVPTGDTDVILSSVRDLASDLLVLEAPGLASADSPFERAVEEIVGRSSCPVILINTCGRALQPRPTSRDRQRAAEAAV